MSERKYMLCPIEGIEEYDTLEGAKAAALKMMDRVSECKGFVVYEVYEVGRFERVSPIWTEPSITGHRPHTIVSDSIDDEIPF